MEILVGVTEFPAGNDMSTIETLEQGMKYVQS